MTASVAHKEDGTPLLQLIVRDTGIGIKNEDKSKIFKMLGKLEATANINTSGVGLGLSTCKKIAEALNGEIFLLEEEPTSKINYNELLIKSERSNN